MTDARPRALASARAVLRGNGKPFGRIRQINDLVQIKFRVIAETGGIESGGVAAPEYRKLTPVESAYSLTRPICDAHGELWRIVIKHRQ